MTSFRRLTVGRGNSRAHPLLCSACSQAASCGRLTASTCFAYQVYHACLHEACVCVCRCVGVCVCVSMVHAFSAPVSALPRVSLSPSFTLNGRDDSPKFGTVSTRGPKVHSGRRKHERAAWVFDSGAIAWACIELALVAAIVAVLCAKSILDRFCWEGGGGEKDSGGMLQVKLTVCARVRVHVFGCVCVCVRMCLRIQRGYFR